MSWQENDPLILHHFAGSGTTAHAVINLNREDGGRRRFILVEMGEYFDTVLLPRIKKVAFTPEWEKEKPKRMAAPEEAERGPRIVRVLRLEQYEDTLNNIEFMVDGAVQKTLDSLDDYMLRYMLDFETRGSPCRVNVDAFKKPFDYRLRVTDSDNELREERVDLVKTFNYLLGIYVKQVKAHHHKGRYYRVVHGQRGDETVAIIWRNTEDLDLEADREFIEATLLGDSRADQVYVNGDSFVRGARPIEPEFKKLMGG